MLGIDEPMREPFTIVEVCEAAQLLSVRALIEQYQRFLGVDLCFQGFEEEMRSFPARFELVLAAVRGGEMIGCVCLKRLAPGVCEMKRLFVVPEAQGTGLGRALCDALISAAAGRGYAEMRLDTLTRLTPALALYRSMGFRETVPYNDNPEPDVVYMSRAI